MFQLLCFLVKNVKNNYECSFCYVFKSRMLRIVMNISVVILCFALIVQLVAGRANQSNSVYLIFCLAHQCNVLHSFEQRQKWSCYSYLFLKRSVFLTKNI